MTKNGFCYLPAIPLRKQASDTSEMVSQILFGETFSILETSQKWSLIQNHKDKYTGFLSNKQILNIEENTLQYLFANSQIVNTIFENIFIGGIKTIIPMGSRLPIEKNFTINNTKFTHTFAFVPKSKTEVAMQLLNAPYLWGGKTFMGIDCSGFTQTVFSTQNIELQRDASQQAEQGFCIENLQQAKQGDLLFFNNDKGRIIHVGMLLDNSKIIHASGCVRIDKIDDKGIFNQTINDYTHFLSKIQRIDN